VAREGVGDDTEKSYSACLDNISQNPKKPELFVVSLADTYGSSDTDYCWMSSNGIYIGFFLVPICAVLVVNMTMLGVVIFKVMRISPRPPMLSQGCNSPIFKNYS
jgi:hypothetical protein